MSKKSKSFLHKKVKPFHATLAITSTLILTLGAILLTSAKTSEVMRVGDVAGVNTGFDELGYNKRARIFIGNADGIDKTLDGKVWGDPLYANDHLVMNWNAEWDRGNAENWSDPKEYDAWEDNEWNGMVPNGSKETWHYKIVWDKGCRDQNKATTSSAKGLVSCIWGQFAIVMSQGTYNGQHLFDVLGKANGYGNAN